MYVCISKPILTLKHRPKSSGKPRMVMCLDLAERFSTACVQCGVVIRALSSRLTSAN